jgi:hypothetical protein
MTTVKLPFVTNSYQTLSGVELTDSDSLVVDGYLSKSGALRQRPATSVAIVTVASGKICDVVDVSDGITVALANTSMRVRYSNYDITSGTNWKAATFTGGFTQLIDTQVPTFAYDGATNFLMARGADMWFTADIMNASGATLTKIVTPGSGTPPTAVNSVAFVDGYFLACQSLENRYYFSATPSGATSYPNSWPAANYMAASRSGDSIVHLDVLDRQIFLFGTRTLEIHQHDGINPFSPVTGGFFNYGCYSRDSVVKTDNEFFWFTNRAKFARFNGTTVIEMDSPFDEEFSSGRFYPKRGHKIKILGETLIVWLALASANSLAYVYNVSTDTWSRWGNWNTTTSSYDAFDSFYSVAQPITGWAGSTSPTSYVGVVGGIDGVLRQFRIGLATDVDTVPIRPYKLTGHINHGTTKFKRASELRFVTDNSTAGTLNVRWNDNNSGVWSSVKSFTMNGTSPAGHIKRLHRPGRYESRQYEMYMLGGTNMVLLDVQEDLEVLRA